jgi:tRNA(Ile)-lysidine synthase
MQLTDTLERDFNAEFDRLLTGSGDGPVALAVSGGGDSMALLALAAVWAETRRRSLSVVSVDHGLRPEAAEEIVLVKDLCGRLGLSHAVLRWSGWDGTGNLQDQARQARKDLIGGWAVENGVRVVATGHTLDDQAETFLMRLARGSGVDGLSAMFDSELFNDIRWVRPLLAVSRTDLRSYLRAKGIGWAEDPSNLDPAYARVRFRQAAEQLAALGLDAKTLAATAGRMQRARHALECATRDLAAGVAQATDIGTVKLDRQGFLAAPEELQLRLLSHAIGWVSRQDYRPRLEPLQQALAAVAAGRNATLGGCIIVTGENAPIEVCREPNAVQPSSDLAALFDSRWQVRCDPAAGAGLTLRALGEDGLLHCPDWRDSGYSRWALMGSPSAWQNDELIAAPFAVRSRTCEVNLLPRRQSFLTSIVKH